MKFKIPLIALFLILLITFNSYPQKLPLSEGEKIIEKYINATSFKDYQVKVEIDIFKGIKGEESLEHTSGIFSSFHNTVYQELGPMRMIIGKDFFIKLNSEQKAMAVGLSSKPLYDESFFNIDGIKMYFKEVKIIEKTQDYFLLDIDMIPSANSYVQKIHMKISRNYRLQKVVMFYNTAYDFSTYELTDDKTVDIPRMEILYRDYSSTVSVKKEKFRAKTYYLYDDNGIKPTKEFQEYEIILLK